MKNLRWKDWLQLQTVGLLICVAEPVLAESCLAPPRPFLPSDSRAILDYENIIRQDFENYISDIQSYFRCLDGERARAFEEAREVSEDYGRFLQVMED